MANGGTGWARAADAWRWIQEAARRGDFVPVIGFQVASDDAFTQARGVEEEYGQVGRNELSPQMRELRLIGAHLASLDERIQTGAQEPGPVHYLPLWSQLEDPTEDDDEDDELSRRGQLIAYIQKSGWATGVGGRGDTYSPVASGEQADEWHELYEDLICEVALLGLASKRAWNGWLVHDPRPLSTLGTEATLRAYDLLMDEDVHKILASCFEHCRVLIKASKAGKWTEPEGLMLEPVYASLLMFASQIYGGSPSDLWEEAPDSLGLDPADFIDDHGTFIDREGEEKTGWTLGHIPEAAEQPMGQAGFGLRLNHVLWLEGLFRHLLLAGTRAYRTREQLMFAVALALSGANLADMSLDPFEVGLITLREGRQVQQLLAQHYTFMETEVGEDGQIAPRQPGAFHQATARIIRAMVDRDATQRAHSGASGRRKTGAVSSSGSTTRAVILSMAFDTEMERALELEFEEYRVLVPILLPLKWTGRGGEEAAAIRKDASGSWEPTWVLLEYEVRVDAETGNRSSVCTNRTDVRVMSDSGDMSAGVEGKGPLLLKLFGSPLSDIGEPGDYGSKSGDVDQAGGRPALHRLVLDARELYGLLTSAVPAQMQGLSSALSKSSIFFFGQDALHWSDHIPFLVANMLIEAPNEQGDSPVDGIAGEGSSEAGSRPRLVSFGRRNEYGESLLLGIGASMNDSSRAKTDRVAKAIIQGIVREGIEGDAHGV